MALVSCFFLTAIFYPIDLPVDMEMEGVELRQDGTTSLVKLRITGQYQWHIFGSDQMSIQVHPEGSLLEDFTVGWSPASLEEGLSSSNAGGGGFTMLGEFRPTPIMAKAELVFLFPSKVDEKDLSKNMISWDEQGRCLVAPASDREHALAILKKHAPEYYEFFEKERIVEAK